MNRARGRSLIDRNGWAWSKLVVQVKRRDGGCRQQDETCAGRLEVDHILSRFEGGGDELSNLRLLCRSHHVRRHNGTPPIEKPRPFGSARTIFTRRVW